MHTADPTYDDRYLAGIVLFNRADFFEAHEVWEALWLDGAGDNKKFYQGLIQAAVGLCHFCNGNVRGAQKLYRSAREYMLRYPSPHLGLDTMHFWERMERCFAPLLQEQLPARAQPDEELFPVIALQPAPAAWPDPAPFLEDEEH